MRFPLATRVLVVFGIALVLLVPLGMIRDKISERSARAAQVQTDYAAETSGPQALAGPFLALTCEETYVYDYIVEWQGNKAIRAHEKRKRACATGLFLPAQLVVDAALPLEQRHRGIYPIQLYRAQLALSGQFASIPPPPSGDTGVQREWKDAYLVIALSDVRGIKAAPAFRIGDLTATFVPGALDSGVKSGLHAPLGSYASLKRAGNLAFDLTLELAGTAKFQVAPVGERSEVRFASAWPHPSFIGGYAPDQREVLRDGFTARWQVNHLATGGPDSWVDAARSDKLLSNPRLPGVSFVEPVNPYSLSYRATEYGFLFVLLTFSMFGLIELAWGTRLHPVQYAFAGLALATFFLLLIALSEHFAFWRAYLAATGACVVLLVFYLRHPLGSASRAALIGALFAALYGALYVLLRSEDHALLLGALLVFGVLAALMTATRKLDWAALSRRLSTAPTAG
jgi:inner membrane protein